MINVRRGTIADISILTDLIFRAKQSNGYDDAFMEATREELRITPENLEKSEYWLAIERQICGCAALTVHGSNATIEDFFIDPEWQRRGVGRVLWDTLRMRASEIGVTRLTLHADPFAVPFYKAIGFVTIGEVPSGSIEGRVLPLMEQII